MTRRRRTRKGASLVEGALILLGLAVTLVGILDLGQYLFFQQTLRERVRAAARYAIVHNYDPQSITNIVVYNTAAAPDDGRRGLLGMTPSMVNVVRHDAGTAQDRIEIVIADYPMRFYSPFLAGGSLQPVFRAVMPVESLGAAE